MRIRHRRTEGANAARIEYLVCEIVHTHSVEGRQPTMGDIAASIDGVDREALESIIAKLLKAGCIQSFRPGTDRSMETYYRPGDKFPYHTDCTGRLVRIKE